MRYLIILLFVFFAFKSGDVSKVKPYAQTKLKMYGPSDVCMSEDGNSLYIVGDDGYLYETDLMGKILRSSKHVGWDYEGVHQDEKYVYVADERGRRVTLFDKTTFEPVRTFATQYGGAMNYGFESITYNTTKKCFVMVTEKNPCLIYEFNDQFQPINTIENEDLPEISSARYYNGFMYFLSDEKMTVYKLDPMTYTVISKVKVPINNPEGLCFDKDGNMVIVSDDMQSIYFFKNPQL